ncbi:MAG: glucose-6-phosphate dehydrogenase assembly protein OpcA [Acidobacteriota bacterium]|nr:glucose-6-phosphate dehydrogenase assembly protein OpcA [Acidobacteriota bacterium]
MQQIQIGKTLDVEIVERQLAELWKQTAGDRDADDEAAVLRARVANLLVFVPSDSMLNEVKQMLAELTAIHPSRVPLMLGRRTGADRDIEMFVTSLCETDKRGVKRLCCEEVTLKAQGSFVAELPSAALPLLVPDLSTFLWWRDSIQTSDKVFQSLLRASDRLVIDSGEFADPEYELVETHKLFDEKTPGTVAISDLNWARLTFWRSLLADFYDVPTCRSWLDRIDHVRIDYVAPESKPTTVAPQALLIAGWLASRLGWSLPGDQLPGKNNETLSFRLSGNDRGSSQGETTAVGDREIRLDLNRVEPDERKPGRLVQVELRTGNHGSFSVARSPDNLRLLTEARLGTKIHRGRVLTVRNRSAARLLSREMEILCNDRIYQEALAVATRMIDRTTKPPNE